MISPDHTNIMPLMTQSEAEALLKRPLPTDSDLKMAERLVGTLEYLPLAIEQAGLCMLEPLACKVQVLDRHAMKLKLTPVSVS